MKTLLLALILMMPALSLAAVPQTRSVEGLSREGGANEQQLPAATIRLAAPQANARRSASHTDCGCFEIFGAWVDQYEDRDGDGYHRKIRVEFDADTRNARETVYAKLYLRREHGPWVLYSETGLFDIRYDEAGDRYEIVTELLEGFPPGRYDLMIELYALYYSGMVASRTVSLDEHGHLLYLEDATSDTAETEVIVITPPPSGEVVIIEDDPYAGGSTPLWILSLGMLALWRRQGKRFRSQ
jgi:hypothetical protein